MKSVWPVLAILLCARFAAGAGAEPPADGLYVLERNGEGSVFMDARGEGWVLAEPLDLPILGQRLDSQNNENDEFYLHLDVPYDGQIHSRTYGLLVSGILHRHAGTGSHSNVSASIGFRIAGEEEARRIADFLQIPIGYRQRLDYVLAAAFTPAQPAFARGEIVTATLRVVNEGPATISFRQGGMNRGFRDNQYVFVARLDGEPVPDVGSDSHMGGLAFSRVLKPGEAFEATADLNDWFAFDRPGLYEIRGSYRMEIRPADAEWTALPWDEAPADDFTVQIVEAAATADPAASETLERFLARMGAELDCYFSVEDVGRPGSASNPTLAARVDPPPPGAIRNVDGLLRFLTNRASLVWEGRKIPLEAGARERDGATIVALSDAGLRHYPWYHRQRFLADDDEGALLRDARSQGGSRRILWQSRARGTGGDLTVEIEAAGRNTDVWRAR